MPRPRTSRSPSPCQLVLLSVVIAAGLLAAAAAQSLLQDHLLAVIAGALAIITLAPLMSRLAVDGTASRRVW